MKSFRSVNVYASKKIKTTSRKKCSNTHTNAPENAMAASGWWEDAEECGKSCLTHALR